METYLISQAASEYVRYLQLNLARVFCHPAMLQEEPFVSLYYRGISGLSLKEVQIQTRSVDNWELEPSARPQKPRITTEAAHQVACLYNSFISSIIENTTNWTLENGYRTMIASIGISFDGGVRNMLGRLPENRVRQLLLRFASDNSLLMEAEHVDSRPDKHSYALIDDFVMIFGSEPDVAFRKDGRLEATVEIKGGIDPAGALERLGAANKSASAALVENPRCKNFLVAGAITAEMRNRMDQDRLFESCFGLVELLSSAEVQERFFDDVFNHALRLIRHRPDG